MVKKDNLGWRPVQLPKELVDEVEKMLQSDIVGKQGITSISQFISRAVSEGLSKLESERFKHMNMYDDHVKIIDNKLDKIGRIVSVYFKKGNRPWCDYCEEPDCIHVQYAWEIADVRKILEKYGFSPPPSKV